MDTIRITVAAATLACLLAACGQDTGTPAAPDTSTSLSTTPSPPTPSESQTSTLDAEIGTAQIKGLGTVLVEQDGRTLYLFTNDTGSKSTCTGDCARTWPALTTEGQPTASGKADDGKLGTTTADGTQQVTYDGHPLYLFSGDRAAGDANGQGIGGVWFAVSPDGNPAGQGGD